MKIAQLITAVLFLSISFTAFADGEGLGGGSSGGGANGSVRVFTPSGAPFDSNTKDLLLQCPDFVTYECLECRSYVIGVNKIDQKAIEALCDQKSGKN